VSEPRAPYGDDVAEEQGEPRRSEPCLKQQHHLCSGEGFEPVPEEHADGFTPREEFNVRRWLCTCGCHIKLGGSF
jgi:hypothetical protein